MRSRWQWGCAKARLWGSTVIVVDVLRHHRPEVTLGEDQHAVCRLPPGTLRPALGDSVRLGRPRRLPDHAYAFGAKDLVKGGREFGVPVPDQDGRSQLAVAQVPREVPGLLRDPGGIGVGGAACEEHPSRVSSMKKKT